MGHRRAADAEITHGKWGDPHRRPVNEAFYTRAAKLPSEVRQVGLPVVLGVAGGAFEESRPVLLRLLEVRMTASKFY